MELENIILSEVSRTQKAKNLMFSLICGLQTQNKCVVFRDMGPTLRGEHA
jgi:hypothetical protein